MTTSLLTTVAAQVTATGISAPSYDDAYQWLVAQYQGIYGSDVVLTADTQDGQWIAILAQAITDVNGAAIAVYNSFSPSTAQGAGLSSVVKINGLTRQSPTYSTCPVLIEGTPGTIITGGTVRDDAGYTWALPAIVTIPSGASITVTASCQTQGAIKADIGAIIEIGTPTRGWLSVTNEVAAAVGVSVESDSLLRQRQQASTALAAKSPMDSIAAQVRNVTGVTRVNWDENVSGTANDNGTPGHSFTMVVEGGSATAIAQAIANSKTPGTGTNGTISEVVIDAYGVPSTISFDAPTYERIVVAVSLKALPGYTVVIGNALVQAIADYINGLEIGSNIYLTQVISAAIQQSGGIGTFNLTSLTMMEFGGSLAAADIPIAFNQAAACSVDDITLSIIS